MKSSLSHDGEPERINYNNQVRDYYLTLPAEAVTSLYKAMKAYDDLLYDRGSLVDIKLNDGKQC